MAMATPQRPLPGGFVNTPAPPRPPVFRMSSNPNPALQRQTQVQPVQQSNGMEVAPATQLTPVERAARAINHRLALETRYPPLEDYVTQGISADYDIPQAGPSQTPSAWAPFQKVRTYEIPERVFEQYNTAEVNTTMGLFAELHHAWIAIDSALYLWDYTHPNPDQTELIGFEDLTHAITAVQLVRPRAGVFVTSITHLLVVTTAEDLHLIGLASSKSPAGVTSVSLYQTGMHVSMKNINVSCVAGSPKTGRIFVGAGSANDVYEITYQQEEKWFSSKCGKICHTDSGLGSSFSKSFPLASLPLPALMFGSPPPKQELVEQIVIDDSRDLLYTLSSASTIRVFHIKPGASLPLLITKTTRELMTVIGHMMNRPQTPLLRPDQKLVSLAPISSSESSRLNLMVTTSTGVRIFLSATSGAYYNDTNSTPSSMQPYHVKFPPPSTDGTSPGPSTSASSQLVYPAAPQIDTTSSTLNTTRISRRYAPGYFFCFVHTQDEHGRILGTADTLFLSAPETGRIAKSLEPGQVRQYMESGQWLQLTGRAEDLGLVSAPFSAARSPPGFGNELAVQFDQTASEIAILTNTGIHTIRRRRLVDIFASAIRASEEGFEETVKKFIRLYGRSETCAAAVAVACGQSMDVTADARVANITDPDVIELARRAFIEHGGKPTLNENNDLGPAGSTTDNVRPSPRSDGLMLYVSRLVRSLWREPLLREASSPTGGLVVTPTVPLSKLQTVQHDLTHLKEFLDANKSFIEGLDGPEALRGAASRQDEITLQGEHRALNSLLKAVASIIEGIAFVMVLFDDPVDEIVLALSDNSRQRVRQLTYERLFCTTDGRELAKELVKAIVNRSIARGSNVDTIAEALRRRCGSFCSADDVVIFKAQEQLKRASEAGADTSSGRSLLNDSLKLFQKVAGSLSSEHLARAVEQYISMSFYAGNLCHGTLF